MKIEVSPQIFKKIPELKFHKDASSRSQAAPLKRTDTMTLTVAFHNFLNMPKNKLNTNNHSTPHTDFNKM